MKFKPPNLKAYKDVKIFYQQDVKSQIGVLCRELSEKKATFQSLCSKISQKVSLLEKLSLMYQLNVLLKKEAKKVLVNHKEKLMKLWTNERCKSPPCVINFNL